MKEKRKIIGFIGATFTFFCIYAVAAAPIPLYAFYQKEIEITNTHLSIISAIYFAGTVCALLIFARVSNYLGRRPVILIIILFSIISCIIFISLQSLLMFMIARLIQGFSCGMASSTVAAYIIDTALEENIGTIITGNIPMLGLALGAIGSGFLKQYEVGTQTEIFQILIILLIICGIFIALGKETIKKSNGVIYSLLPQIKIPENVKKFFPTASAVFIGTWAIGGFYQAFSASMALEQFGTTNTIIAASIFTCLQFPSLFGGSLAGKFKTETAQKIGMLCFFLSMIIVTISLKNGNVVLFLIATVIAGTVWALGFTATIKNILSRTKLEDRAGVLSLIYLISYSGAAIPNLIAGYLAKYFNLFQVSIGYTGVVGITCIFLFISFKKESENLKARRYLS